MEGSKKPHLVAYRKDSSDRVFRVERKSPRSQQAGAAGGQGPQPKYREPERRRCDCGGADHPVFSNCMGCGRLSCKLEKEGPCAACGAHVYPVDSDRVPAAHRESPDFKLALALRDKLLACDRAYQAADFKVHDLHSGWFEESLDVYNEDSDLARLEWLREEAAKREQGNCGSLSEVLKYDLDLYTGRLSVSHSDQRGG